MNRQTDMPTDDDFYIDESAFFDPVFVPWRSFKAFLTVYDIGIGGYQPGYMEGTQALSRNVTHLCHRALQSHVKTISYKNKKRVMALHYFHL
jgi:hypothetical protein